jgi:hypothetical protein
LHVERRQAGRPKAVRYIFIVTYGRSGSTLLQKIIAQIPGCHMTGENDDALGGLYRSWKSATVARTVHGSRPRPGPGEPWRGAHRIDPHRYNRRLARVFLKEIVRPPIGAKWIGFKEIRYFLHYEENLTDYLDYIRMTFSPALLVFNRRCAAEVAQSAWWKTYPTDVAAKVTAMDAVMETYAAEHPDDTVILDYDSWSVDPDLLRPLHERLRTPFDERRIRKVLSERLTHV